VSRRPVPLGPAGPVAGGADIVLAAGDVRLAATRWAGPEPTVVLLHGLASQRRFWNPVVRRLAGRAAVMAVDLRGHGDSDQPSTGYDLATVAADVAAALRAAEVGSYLVVGHSWGAQIATRLAADHDEVVGVVALDGGFTPPVPVGDRAEVRRRLEPPRLQLSPAQVERMLGPDPDEPWRTDETRDAVLPVFAVGSDGLARARFPFDLHMQVVDAFLGHDPADLWPRIRVPTWLVACGPVHERDEDALRAARIKEQGLLLAADALAHPRLLRWVGAVHDVPLQWPDLVAGLVLSAWVEAAAGGRAGA
jgi:pimeloyl-ACP methyl ester carboxylesterase